jgi:hypothetical protein
MKLKFILSIDPSGAFKEGKGTTGWCLFSHTTDRIISLGEISAHKFDNACDYWEAHLNLINAVVKHIQTEYPDAYLRVVIEDYLLYAHKANSQINSRMETSQLLGILKQHLHKSRLPYRIRPASQVMKRWNNKILLRKGYIEKFKNRWVFKKQFLNDHKMDAIRHAVHESTFYMEKECENEQSIGNSTPGCTTIK